MELGLKIVYAPETSRNELEAGARANLVVRHGTYFIPFAECQPTVHEQAQLANPDGDGGGNEDAGSQEPRKWKATAPIPDARPNLSLIPATRSAYL